MEYQQVVQAILVEGALQLPVQPLYTLNVAAVLVPCTRATLDRALATRRNEFPPPVYRRMRNGSRMRLISGEDIRKLRAVLLKGPPLMVTPLTTPVGASTSTLMER